METSVVVDTSLGPVEVAMTGGGGDAVVLVFPGGHTTADTPVGSNLYTDLGYRVVAFSRPGDGRTEVAATVGVSFGGQVRRTAAGGRPRRSPT